MRIFSAEQVEILVVHWLNTAVRPKYARVVRYGGSGDKGRDVVGYPDQESNTPWDTYQCKRYAAPLAPSDVWIEIGKVVFYSDRGDYPPPSNYYFVAPSGVGPSLNDKLNAPEDLRAGLINSWPTSCSSLCPLDEIADAIASFKFSIFKAVSPEQIVQDLQGTPSFSIFFGGGLSKPRPDVDLPPTDLAETELPYVNALVRAYDDDASGTVADAEAAFASDVYGPHLRRSRAAFYCAESLREFSKDVLIEGESFNALQDEMFDGVVDTAAADHSSGYQRVLRVAAQATNVALSDHPLIPVLEPRDRVGICHQLANSTRLRWVPE